VKYFSQPASEKFFHEIDNHFQEAQAELKKQAEGLKKLDERTSLVSSTLRRRAGTKETNRSKLISWPSMGQRDLQVCVCNRAAEMFHFIVHWYVPTRSGVCVVSVLAVLLVAYEC